MLHQRFDIHSKTLQIANVLPNCLHRVICITSFVKELESSPGHTPNLYLNMAKTFQKYVSEGISHPVFYGDLVSKLRRVKCEANCVPSGSKIIKHLRRRKYDPVIIERTICLVPCPFTALYRSFLKHCTLTNTAMGTIWRDLSKPP